ncbi:MAG: hypothetical protein LBR83_08800 [Clostridiales bacterium]|jgi:hypothetical protein|nr:hypothetical protein [Clostridiales bacterium]
MIEAKRVFEMGGNRFEVTPEFDAHNAVRSEQLRKESEITARYTQVALQCKADFEALAQQAAAEYAALINHKINSAMEVASVGFAGLQRYKDEALPRIGKRLIFKYTSHELITVEEVAGCITFDPAEYFTGFLNEIQEIEDRKMSFMINQEYKRMTRSDPAAGGIGFGARGIAGAAAGTLAVSAGSALLRGIGGMIGQGLSSAFNARETAKSVESGKQALIKAFGDIAGQVGALCVGAIEAEMNAELKALDIKPYKAFSESYARETEAKTNNYDKAYINGDITPEKYASHIFTLIRDNPYHMENYRKLYKIALDTGDGGAKTAIIEFTRYLGLEQPMAALISAEAGSAEDSAASPGDPPAAEAPAAKKVADPVTASDYYGKWKDENNLVAAVSASEFSMGSEGKTFKMKLTKAEIRPNNDAATQEAYPTRILLFGKIVARGWWSGASPINTEEVYSYYLNADKNQLSYDPKTSKGTFVKLP